MQTSFRNKINVVKAALTDLDNQPYFSGYRIDSRFIYSDINLSGFG